MAPRYLITAPFFLTVSLFAVQGNQTHASDSEMPSSASETQPSDPSLAAQYPFLSNPIPKCTCKPSQQSKPVCKCNPQKVDQEESEEEGYCEVHKRTVSSKKQTRESQEEEVADYCEVHKCTVKVAKKPAKADSGESREDKAQTKVAAGTKKQGEAEAAEYYEVQFKPVKKESGNSPAQTKELAQTSMKIDSSANEMSSKEEKTSSSRPNELAKTETTLKNVKEPCLVGKQEAGRTSIVVESSCSELSSNSDCCNPCPPEPDCCNPPPVNPCQPDPCCNPCPPVCNSNPDCCPCGYCFDYSSQFFSRTGLDVFGEGLFWSTNYNLPFSFMLSLSQNVASPSSTLLITTTDTQFSIQRVNNKWSPGFRAGIGGYTDCDDFDLQLIGTYYENHAKTAFSGLNDALSNGVLVGPFNEAAANLQLIYRVGDIELGKNYFAFSRMLFRPFWGIRGGWLDQDHRVHYLRKTSTTLTTGPAAGTTITRPTPLTLHFDQNLWCVGPRMGLNTSWGKGGGLSWIANISASLLYGKAQQKFLFETVSDALNTAGSAVNETVTDTVSRDRFWELFPTLQLLMGVSWESCIFKMYAAYEANFWWEASNVLIFERSISMQGLTGGIGVNF